MDVSVPRHVLLLPRGDVIDGFGPCGSRDSVSLRDDDGLMQLDPPDIASSSVAEPPAKSPEVPLSVSESRGSGIAFVDDVPAHDLPRCFVALGKRCSPKRVFSPPRKTHRSAGAVLSGRRSPHTSMVIPRKARGVTMGLEVRGKKANTKSPRSRSPKPRSHKRKVSATLYCKSRSPNLSSSDTRRVEYTSPTHVDATLRAAAHDLTVWQTRTVQAQVELARDKARALSAEIARRATDTAAVLAASTVAPNVATTKPKARAAVPMPDAAEPHRNVISGPPSTAGPSDRSTRERAHEREYVPILSRDGRQVPRLLDLTVQRPGLPTDVAVPRLPPPAQFLHRPCEVSRWQPSATYHKPGASSESYWDLARPHAAVFEYGRISSPGLPVQRSERQPPTWGVPILPPPPQYWCSRGGY